MEKIFNIHKILYKLSYFFIKKLSFEYKYKLYNHLIDYYHVDKNRDFVFERRERLSEKIINLFDNTIRYGPFKGLKLSNNISWGLTDRAAMLFGIYEKEVLDWLSSLSEKRKYFIDLGAADGYYALGMIKSKKCEFSFCYEILEESQKVIHDNAKLNNLSDKIEVRGEASKNFVDDFSSNELDNAIIFVDVEGHEFSIFNKDVLKKCRNAIMIVELHEWLIKDGTNKLKIFIKNAKQYFDISFLTTSSRDLSNYEELKYWNDTDRWLLCSEGRGRLMSWCILEPIN